MCQLVVASMLINFTHAQSYVWYVIAATYFHLRATDNFQVLLSSLLEAALFRHISWHSDTFQNCKNLSRPLFALFSSDFVLTGMNTLHGNQTVMNIVIRLSMLTLRGVSNVLVVFSFQERNFHVFYYMFAGLPEAMLSKVHLKV